MSGDRPTERDLTLPVHGTAAGSAYLALPPTAVDARPAGPTGLIVAWPGFDPPRAAAALATAMPMTGVPVWRVYLELPGDAEGAAGGLGSGAILESRFIEAYGAAVEEASERLPDALADIRRDLGLDEGPVGLAGFSAGGSAALLAVARGAVPISTAAVVAPVIAPSRSAGAVEKRAARDRAWTEEARELADRLDLGMRAADIAARDTALLLIGGAKDRVVPPAEITALRDLLRRCGAGAVESATFRMAHALAAEPGTAARPPITEAVRVDGVLTDWFRERIAETVPGAEPAAGGEAIGADPPDDAADETAAPNPPAHAWPAPPAANGTAASEPASPDVTGTWLEPASGGRGRHS
ncbi:alpha/beta hydrolase family protein [Actinomadura xylanilytica]|uniref:alpha/beta hydrolase family protein n=1 Tax=Actinomadura xylanilytica TaxID=887459 RepID=UPI00255AC5FA|nr:hypothetical protein [Actinomadura xylanilytica]MDL4773297.1 hypothetical protein [Actinomadura xylanilytica]